MRYADGYGSAKHEVLSLLLSWLAFSLSDAALAQNSASRSGSGVVVGSRGEILTNYHVVDGCSNITAQLPNSTPEDAVLVARDHENDLAVIRIKSSPSLIATFRGGPALRIGDHVIALGYPLYGILASTVNVSVGIVSALAGLGDDSRYIQISTPVQPGNSGGPLLDASGHLVGIVAAKLDAIRAARQWGDIPQNVNFAIKAEVVRAFLESRGFKYQTGGSDQQLGEADVADSAKLFKT
jgi:S1-C subfamily serine protease